jgi:hypothetical protein
MQIMNSEASRDFEDKVATVLKELYRDNYSFDQNK